MRLFGLASGGAYLAKGALAAATENGGANGTGVHAKRVAIARAFASQLSPETSGLRLSIIDGAGPVADAHPELLVI